MRITARLIKPRIIPLKIDDHIIVPRQIVRAVHLPFSELQFNSDFERLLHAMGVEQSPFGETTELDVTFSRGRVFDTKLEAGIFASNLIANHPQISAKFQKLSAKARFAAGGRWQMPSPQEIIWEAETLRASRQPQFVRLSNYKIVVVFALHCGYNGGYSSYERVVVEISASHLLKYDRLGEEGDLVLHSDTLSLKFEGFRAVTSLPLDLE